MATDVTADLKEFRDFVDRQLGRGGPTPSPEECVRLWRERQEVNAAIREGLEQMRAGLGRPLEEFAAEFRRRNGIAADE